MNIKILVLTFILVFSNELVAHSVKLTCSGVDGTYTWYRSTTSGSGYVRRATTSVKNWTDKNVKNGKTYYYVVTVKVKKVESNRSNEQKAVIPIH